MCSKRNELWNTSLLFDLNYKFELIGASLLALAKSIYYALSVVLMKQKFEHQRNYTKRDCVATEKIIKSISRVEAKSFES